MKSVLNSGPPINLQLPSVVGVWSGTISKRILWLAKAEQNVSIWAKASVKSFVTSVSICENSNCQTSHSAVATSEIGANEYTFTANSTQRMKKNVPSQLSLQRKNSEPMPPTGVSPFVRSRFGLGISAAKTSLQGAGVSQVAVSVI